MHLNIFSFINQHVLLTTVLQKEFATENTWMWYLPIWGIFYIAYVLNYILYNASWFLFSLKEGEQCMMGVLGYSTTWMIEPNPQRMGIWSNWTLTIRQYPSWFFFLFLIYFFHTRQTLLPRKKVFSQTLNFPLYNPMS